MSGAYYVYILANRKHGTLYIGITNDIVRRVHEHKLKLVPGSRPNTALTSLSILKFSMIRLPQLREKRN